MNKTALSNTSEKIHRVLNINELYHACIMHLRYIVFLIYIAFSTQISVQNLLIFPWVKAIRTAWMVMVNAKRNIRSSLTYSPIDPWIISISSSPDCFTVVPGIAFAQYYVRFMIFWLRYKSKYEYYFLSTVRNTDRSKDVYLEMKLYTSLKSL